MTRTPSRGPFVLARTVVLVSALALLGYLPAANPLTAPSRRERPPANLLRKLSYCTRIFSRKCLALRVAASPPYFTFAFQADVVLAFSVENVSPFGWRLRRHTSPSPSLGVRASGLNCRARASPGIVGLKPQQADLLRKFFRLPPSNPGRLKLYALHIVLQ